jgi:hypothetical protein
MRRQDTKVSDQMLSSALSLKVLSRCQVQQIDDMLSEMGAFGELRLIKKKGQVRFIEKVESFDLLDAER